jgi:hypothetical protein
MPNVLAAMAAAKRVHYSAGMHRLDHDHYLLTPSGLAAQYWHRRGRRIYVDITGIEPRAKHSMRDTDKDAIQQRLLAQLVARRRRAFRGPLALQMRISTTARTPTHAPQITKNLLDLFGEPRPGIATRRPGLLFADDSQVHALSVTCLHGEEKPAIAATATPLDALRADLRLIMHHERTREPSHEDWENRRVRDRAVDELRKMLRDEAALRRRDGDRLFEFCLEIARREAQERLLEQPALRPIDLACMFDVDSPALGVELAAWRENLFVSSPLRIRLSELPQVTGASAVWVQEIDTKLRDFRQQYGWLIDPLVIPVALEVVIKPPPPSRQNALHDLDNVLREYLLPALIDILKPVSHYSFALARLHGSDDPPPSSDLVIGRDTIRLSRPPASTRMGVTRFEAWRLPPAKTGSLGFVSVAIVADMSGFNDLLSQIDEEIEECLDAMKRQPSSGLGWRRG